MNSNVMQVRTIVRRNKQKKNSPAKMVMLVQPRRWACKIVITKTKIVLHTLRERR